MCQLRLCRDESSVAVASEVDEKRRFLWNQNVVKEPTLKGNGNGFVNERGEKFFRAAVWLWLIFGSVIALWSYYYLCKQHFRNHEVTLASMCDERARILQDQFVASMTHVKAMTVLVSIFDLEMACGVNQSVFASYTARTAFERPLMSGVAYAKRVFHHERDEFEKNEGWNIRHMYSKEVQSPQEEYAPTIFSQDTVSYLISLDMMSGEHDRENILRARESGKGALTSPFRLLDSSRHLGVVFTFAVYNRDLPAHASSEDRIKATVGYLGGAFDVESLVENLLRQLADKLPIEVNVYDTTNETDPVLMYGSGSRRSSGYHVSELDFGDPFRKHEMRCRHSEEPKSPLSAILTCSGIFVIVLLLAHILHAAITRLVKIEKYSKELEELKGRAEAADVAKSQFLATVSHEIRTPMNGVLGMLQMLMETNLDSTQKDYAQTAEASGKALITLINHVLDQSKIESGRIELATESFNVRTVLDSVLSLFSAKSQAKDIELAVFVSERIPEILVGDPGRFQQIVTNLVSNSVKFTESGHIFVCVHLEEEKGAFEEGISYHNKQREDPTCTDKDLYNTLSGIRAADGRLTWESLKIVENNRKVIAEHKEEGDVIKIVVTVEDTGIGIPHHAQHRIFTPFMQADSSTSRKYGGTGIGLSISKCFVETMGGEIGFTSHSSIGSTFYFTVPFKLGEYQVDSSIGEHQFQAQFKGMKAVILDGRPVRSLVTSYHLERLGIEVDCIMNSSVALATLNKIDDSDSSDDSSAKDAVEMVFIEKDAWGHGTGLRFPSQIKAGNSKGRFKMILLATSLTADERVRAKAVGFSETAILKPLRTGMLQVSLQLALGYGRRRGKGNEPTKPSYSLKSVLSGKYILVVDDNLVNRRVAEAALRKFGCNVACADSGKTAISLLCPPHNFDACFMDVQMPEMDGFEATRQIRAAELASIEASNDARALNKRCHMPILAMTADVIQATREECLRCGMDGYVAKPFEEEQLYKALAPLFDR